MAPSGLKDASAAVSLKPGAGSPLTQLRASAQSEWLAELSTQAAFCYTTACLFLISSHQQRQLQAILSGWLSFQCLTWKSQPWQENSRCRERWPQYSQHPSPASTSQSPLEGPAHKTVTRACVKSMRENIYPEAGKHSFHSAVSQLGFLEICVIIFPLGLSDLILRAFKTWPLMEPLKCFLPSISPRF